MVSMVDDESTIRNWYFSLEKSVLDYACTNCITTEIFDCDDVVIWLLYDIIIQKLDFDFDGVLRICWVDDHAPFRASFDGNDHCADANSQDCQK